DHRRGEAQQCTVGGTRTAKDIADDQVDTAGAADTGSNDKHGSDGHQAALLKPASASSPVSTPLSSSSVSAAINTRSGPMRVAISVTRMPAVLASENQPCQSMRPPSVAGTV